jgi:hypothetical protein
MIQQELPELKKKLGLDMVIANGENAAHGFGITAQICHDLHEAGVDCITTGNHIWDQREIIPYIEKTQKLLRPINYPKETVGQGYCLIPHGKGQVLVINVMGRLFMDALDDPFRAVDEVLQKYKIGLNNLKAIIVDIHAETSSEKAAMAYFCDGKVSLVVGTHTHVPTADSRILPKGTAFQTDAGMCGPYDSVIGMDAHLATQKFVTKMPGERLRPAEGAVTLAGVLLETDDETGLAKRIKPFRMGGVLMAQMGW